MNKRTDNERLLTDVLTGESEDGFRDALLEETLRLARRRRRTRQARRVVGVLAVLIVTAITAWRVASSRVSKPEIAHVPPSPTSYQLVVNEPLSPGQIVTTLPLTTGQLVASVATASVVRTTSGGFREVGDDELLALAAPQVVALVRRGPHEAELVFVTAADGEALQ